MTDSIREKLIAAIVTKVSGVYGIPAPEDERDLPITVVQEGADTATPGYDSTYLTMPVTIGRFEKCTTSDRATMRKQANVALSNIITTMHTDETFGGFASKIQYLGGGIETENSQFVIAEASFNIFYSHLRGNPLSIT